MPRRELRKDQVAVRLDEPTVARLDALLHIYTIPGRVATRSDGLRAVILAGLDVEERRAAQLVWGKSEASDVSPPPARSNRPASQRPPVNDGARSPRRRP